MIKLLFHMIQPFTSEEGEDFTNCSKKGCFLSFEWEKTNFTTFGPPAIKILEKSSADPPLGKILPTPTDLANKQKNTNSHHAKK